MPILLLANSVLASPSCSDKLIALTVALSSVFRNEVDTLLCPLPSNPIRSPASTHRCLHVGDLSSAPLMTAIAHSSLPRALRVGREVGEFDESSSCCVRCMAAELKMLRIRIVVRKPSGRCHIEGAERTWEARSVTFKGLESRVRRVVADPRSLQTLAMGSSIGV